MNALIFDTETTGLPLKNNVPLSPANISNFPRVIQLAWDVVDIDTGEVIKSKSYLIYPDGWEVPNEKFWIENNHSTQRCKDEGRPIQEVLQEFLTDHKKCGVMVAHNMSFDYPVLGSEMIRYNISTTHKIPKHCTKEGTTGYLKLPGKNGLGFKPPKLIELYRFLFQKDFSGAHDAGFDVAACRESYVELVKRGLKFSNV